MFSTNYPGVTAADAVPAAPEGPGPDGILLDDPSTVCVALNDPAGCDESADNTPATPEIPAVVGIPAANWANVGGNSVTGLDQVDLWVGGLAEQTNLFGGLLGTTFNYVFELQLTQLQDGDRLYYLNRTPGMNLRAQLEGNSFAELVMRNTTATGLKADAFGTADCKFELGLITFPASAGTNIAGGPNITGAGSVNDVPTTECDENALLIRATNGTISYRPFNSVDPSGINGQSVYNGTAGDDRVAGGNDNDTFRGKQGADIIEGNGGDDESLGGIGNDIITDLAGDDTLKGGPGNDALDGGIGLDLLLGGDGVDLMVGGANTNAHFAGEGDDFILGGQGADEVIGDSGDDWQEGGDQTDLLIGDSSSLFFDDHNQPGNDILIGQAGDDDYDMEGGDDIGVAGPGIEKNAGAAGYDWTIGLRDPQPQVQDLELQIVEALPVNVIRDRFNEVEALSGWNLNDILRGDSLPPSQRAGIGFIGCDALDAAGVARIVGLDTLVPASLLTVDSAPIIAASATNHCPLVGQVWGEGNILLGGGGSDLLEGRGADDIIDGDRYLSVRLSVRTNPADPLTEIGTTDLFEHTALGGTFGTGTAGKTLQQAVFAGLVDPGNIVAVRELLPPAVHVADCGSLNPLNCDTALFSRPFSATDYTIVTNVDGSVTVTDIGTGGGGGVLSDGIDTLWNIEQLGFCTANDPGNGLCTAFDTMPVTAFAPTAAVTPAVPLAFGDVITGVVSAPKTITVTNNGAAVLNVGPVTLGGTDPGQFAIGANSCSAAVLGPTGACTIDVTFEPTIDGVYSATVSIAHNGAGSPSTVDLTGTGIPGVVPVPPLAPTIGTATAGITSATVTWTAPVDNGGPAITSYEIVATPTAGPAVTLTGVAPTATSGTVTGLTAGTSYTLQVRAVNADGSGPLSAASNAVIPTALVAPTTPTGVIAVGGDASASLSWTEGIVPVTSHVIQVRPAGGVTTLVNTGPASTAVITGLVNGTRYTFKVRAVNAVGVSAFSAASNRITPAAPAPPATVPGAPVIGLATPGGGGGALTARVLWTPPLTDGGSAITGYQVTAIQVDALGVDTGVTVLGPLRGPGARSQTLTLPAGNYVFTVVAINAIGTSDPSVRSNMVTAT